MLNSPVSIRRHHPTLIRPKCMFNEVKREKGSLRRLRFPSPFSTYVQNMVTFLTQFGVNVWEVHPVLCVRCVDTFGK